MPGGTLIDGRWGGELYALDLSDGSHRKLAWWPSLRVMWLSRIDGHRLLVSYESAKAGKRLAIHDLRSNGLEDLMEGSRGVYMPEPGVIAHYTGYGHRQLRIADLSGRVVETVDVEATGYFPVVPVSGSAFVYESSRGGALGVWLHDLGTGESVELPGLRHCSLHHAVWRSAAGELLCPERTPEGRYTGRRISTGLDGGGRRVVDFGRGSFWPVAYLAHADALVVQERTASLRRGEYHPLHIYRFSDRSMTKVADDVYVGPVVYMEPGALEGLRLGETE